MDKHMILKNRGNYVAGGNVDKAESYRVTDTEIIGPNEKKAERQLQ
jgi:hypothetical protein